MGSAPISRAWPILLVAAGFWFWPVPWSLWTDEFFSAGFAHRELAEVVGGAARDRHPPAFFLMVWLVGHLTGSDNGLRAVSGLAMLGALAVTVDAARRHLSSRTSLAVGAWFAASAVPALFAHTLRMYGMVTFAAALLLWGALESTAAEDSAARRGRWVLAAGGILAFWTHYAAVLVGVAAFAAAFAAVLLPGAAAPRRQRLPPLVGAAAAVVVGCLPWLLGPFRTQFTERDPVGSFVWEVWAYLFWSPNEALPPLSFVAFGVVAAGGVWLVRRGGRSVGILAGTFLLAMILLPFLASANVPARLVRNYVGFFPAAAFFAGAGLDALAARLLRRRTAAGDWAGAGLATVLTAPLTLGLLSQPFHPQDINSGHDYRIEATVLDSVIPADASVKFQPSYVVEQFARYAPALRTRTGKPHPEWQLLTSGGKLSPCLVLHAFRVRVQPPEAECPALLAALSTAADDTGYPGLLLDRAARRLQAGELDAAEADLDKLLATPQRWPMAWILAGQLAEARQDDAGTLAAYTEALRLARAFEPPGKVLSTLWKKIAKLQEAAGDSAGAEAAKAAGVCAAEREPAWACGGPLAWATRPAESFGATEEGEDPPVKSKPEAEAAPPLDVPAAVASADPAEADGDEGDEPAPTPEPVEAAPAAAAPTAAARTVPTKTGAGPISETPAKPGGKEAGARATSASGGEAKRPAGAGASSTSFGSGLPPGWITEGVVKPGGGGLIIGDGSGSVSSVCSPAWSVSGPVRGTVTRSAELSDGEPPTWTRIEARALDGNKRGLAGSKPENLGSKKVSQPMGPVEFTWVPPPGAAAWRLCVKTGGAGKGTTTLQAISVGG